MILSHKQTENKNKILLQNSTKFESVVCFFIYSLFVWLFSSGSWALSI